MILVDLGGIISNFLDPIHATRIEICKSLGFTCELDVIYYAVARGMYICSFFYFARFAPSQRTLPTDDNIDRQQRHLFKWTPQSPQSSASSTTVFLSVRRETIPIIPGLEHFTPHPSCTSDLSPLRKYKRPSPLRDDVGRESPPWAVATRRQTLPARRAG